MGNTYIELTDVTDLPGVSDLYILNFLADLSGSFAARPTSASISFPKWKGKVGKGFDFGKQDINISLTFLNGSGLGPDNTNSLYIQSPYLFHHQSWGDFGKS
jgi:hypothetical protein